MFTGLITFEPKINLYRLEIDTLQMIVGNFKNTLFKLVFLQRYHTLPELIFVFEIQYPFLSICVSRYSILYFLGYILFARDKISQVFLQEVRTSTRR